MNASIQYFIGSIYLVFSFIYFYFVGSIFCLETDIFAKKISIGFIISTCILSVFGLITQIFRLPVIYFYYIYIIIIVFFIGLYILKKRRRFQWTDLVEHVKHHYFIYVILICLVVLSVQHLNLQWLSNHLDDGRYLNLSSLYPLMDKPYFQNGATGLPTHFDLLRSLNTFELESSFWIWLLKIEPSIFTRVFLTAVNYFITLCSIVYLASVVSKERIQKKYLQYSVLPVVIFMFSSKALQTYFFVLQDDWQFLSAMWYGSSIVRMAGTFLILAPLLDKKIEIKSVIFYGIISIVLVTRASQALPILVLILFAYLITVFFEKKHLYGITALFSIILLSILSSFVLNVNEDLIATVNLFIMNNRQSYFLLLIIVFAFVLVFYLRENQYLRRLMCIYAVCVFLMFMPKINTIFLITSQYTFVVGRTVTSFVFLIVIVSWMCFLMVILRYRNLKKVVPILSICFCMMISLFIIKRGDNGHGAREKMSIILENNKIIPNSILYCSETIEKYANQSDEKMIVLSPEFVYEDNYLTAFCTMLRVKAPNMISLSAKPRYDDCVEASPYYTFGADQQNIVNDFTTTGNNFDAFSIVIEAYDINCIIVLNEEAANQLKDIGYKVIDEYSSKSNNYYILSDI